MPRRDGTGPFGQGMMTGRRSGRCVTPINTDKQCFLGFGYRKARCGINRNFNTGINKQLLQDQLNDLQIQIDALK